MSRPFAWKFCMFCWADHYISARDFQRVFSPSSSLLLRTVDIQIQIAISSDEKNLKHLSFSLTQPLIQSLSYTPPPPPTPSTLFVPPSFMVKKLYRPLSEFITFFPLKHYDDDACGICLEPFTFQDPATVRFYIRSWVLPSPSPFAFKSSNMGSLDFALTHVLDRFVIYVLFLLVDP